MDALAEAVKAADGPWPVIAIAILGLYALLWKYGHDLLVEAKQSKQQAEAAHQEAKAISSSIVTNHGSKNLGHAVDLLTEQTGLLREQMAFISLRLDRIELEQQRKE